MKVPKLQSDEEMEILFPPHPEKDFEELEKDIIKNGCNKPLTVWRNILIDGHARFEICIKHNIRFLIKYVYFDTREEAIDFICTNQLEKTFLTEEMRKYLIGKKYEMKKILGAMENYQSETYKSLKRSEFKTVSACRNHTATAIGLLYGLSYSTVYKYNIFTKMIDSLRTEHPTLVTLILSSHLKVSHSVLEEVVKLPSDEISKLEQNKKLTDSVKYSYKEIRNSIKPVTNHKKKTILSSSLSIEKKEVITPGIKNLPEYDPDADIKSLMFTIPSWISSIKRTKNVTIIDNTSLLAREKLITQLMNLQSSIDEMMNFLKGATNDGSRI